MGFRYNSNEDIKVALKDSNGIRLTYELMHIKNNIINNYVIQAKIHFAIQEGFLFTHSIMVQVRFIL